MNGSPVREWSGPTSLLFQLNEDAQPKNSVRYFAGTFHIYVPRIFIGDHDAPKFLSLTLENSSKIENSTQQSDSSTLDFVMLPENFQPVNSVRYRAPLLQRFDLYVPNWVFGEDQPPTLISGRIQFSDD
jgi:hypothetical protein